MNIVNKCIKIILLGLKVSDSIILFKKYYKNVSKLYFGRLMISEFIKKFSNNIDYKILLLYHRTL